MPAALPPEAIEYEAWWGLDPVWTQKIKHKFLVSASNRNTIPRIPFRNLITISNTCFSVLVEIYQVFWGTWCDHLQSTVLKTDVSPKFWFVFNSLRGVTYKRPLIGGYVSLQNILPHLCVAIHGVVEGSHRRLAGAELYCLLDSCR